MTTADQLRSVCEATPGFLGVYAADQLPAFAHDNPRSGHDGEWRKAPALIANYDDAAEPGSHWVAMRFPHGEAAEYFDSFGLQPDAEDALLQRQTHFLQYAKKHSGNGHVRSNDRDLQRLDANACGEWAALFVIIGALPQDASKRAVWRPFLESRTPDALVQRVIGLR